MLSDRSRVVLAGVSIMVLLFSVAGCGKLWTVKTADLAMSKARSEGRELGQNAGNQLVLQGNADELVDLTRAAADCAEWLADGTFTSPDKRAAITGLAERLDSLLMGLDRVVATYLTENCEGDPVCETGVAEFAAGIAEGLNDIRKEQ